MCTAQRSWSLEFEHFPGPGGDVYRRQAKSTGFKKHLPPYGVKTQKAAHIPVRGLGSKLRSIGGLLCDRCGAFPRPRVLHVLVHPVDHLRNRMKRRFASDISVWLERQRHIAHCSTVTL
jgi:hypothetical protein